MNEVMLRLILPLLLSVVTAWAVDLFSTRRHLQAPGFLRTSRGFSAGRRLAYFGVFSFGLYLTVFQSVALFGIDPEVDMSEVASWQLFLVHWLLLGMLLAWYLLGFSRLGISRRRFWSEWCRQFGLVSPKIGREVLLGLGLGIVGWLVVLVVVSLVGTLFAAVGGSSLLPSDVPPSIVWMASLSIPLRLLIALSAGIVEELFFRGFLQPRLGILFSSLLFVLAHLSYGQPFLLIGVTLLSVGFAYLAYWRRSIWASISAHFTFDAVQLLILIPAALRFADTGG